jgi:hypothetical protein
MMGLGVSKNQALVLDIQTEDPLVVLTVDNPKSSSFWIREPTSLSFLFLQVPGITTKSAFGHIGSGPRMIFYSAFGCFWGNLHFCHSFVLVPETSIPLL